MIPVGYMAKKIPRQTPDWLKAPVVQDVYSVSACVNDDAFDVPRWEQNGFGLFNSQRELRTKAGDGVSELQGTLLFYYEAYESEFDGEGWFPMTPDEGYETLVSIPSHKRLEGFDIVTFCDGPNSHSPLSCNSVAAEIKTNEHCLFETKEEALANLSGQVFKDAEPGPYRIYAVYTVDWDEL